MKTSDFCFIRAKPQKRIRCAWSLYGLGLDWIGKKFWTRCPGWGIEPVQTPTSKELIGTAVVPGISLLRIGFGQLSPVHCLGIAATVRERGNEGNCIPTWTSRGEPQRRTTHLMAGCRPWDDAISRSGYRKAIELLSSGFAVTCGHFLKNGKFPVLPFSSPQCTFCSCMLPARAL